MSKSTKQFDEIRIRNFPPDKKVRLMKRAQREGKSLQEFMYEHMLRLADGEEIAAVQYKMLEQQSQLAQIIQANTEALFVQEKRWRALLGEEEE